MYCIQYRLSRGFSIKTWRLRRVRKRLIKAPVRSTALITNATISFRGFKKPTRMLLSFFTITSRGSLCLFFRHGSSFHFRKLYQIYPDSSQDVSRNSRLPVSVSCSFCALPARIWAFLKSCEWMALTASFRKIRASATIFMRMERSAPHREHVFVDLNFALHTGQRNGVSGSIICLPRKKVIPSIPRMLRPAYGNHWKSLRIQSAHEGRSPPLYPHRAYS